MSFLRIGYLTSFLPIETIRQMKMVDIGSGNNIFYNVSKTVFKEAYAYDVAGESISKESLYSLSWDLVTLFDVLEHFEDIDDLFKINWKYAFISFPETPKVNSWEELKTWRHFKPNEHIWCLNKEGVTQWFNDNNCLVLGVSHFEDLIRVRWNPDLPNITSMVIERS
jgi:hypothetical protein